MAISHTPIIGTLPIHNSDIHIQSCTMSCWEQVPNRYDTKVTSVSDPLEASEPLKTLKSDKHYPSNALHMTSSSHRNETDFTKMIIYHILSQDWTLERSDDLPI
jgi:hypothetical protein